MPNFPNNSCNKKLMSGKSVEPRCRPTSLTVCSVHQGPFVNHDFNLPTWDADCLNWLVVLKFQALGNPEEEKSLSEVKMKIITPRSQ